MNDYQEAYEEINNLEEMQGPEDERYKYPDYQSIPIYYNNDYPSPYERENNIQKEIRPKNNVQTKREEAYNYYVESTSPYNDNQLSRERLSNKKCYTPDRTSNSNNYNNNNNYNARLNSYYNLREEYSNPVNTRVNIKKRVYQGNHTPQPYISNNENYYDNNKEEFIDNYQYHETKNIKNKGFKKYDSITHIIGYSNLIPLNRMRNIYGNDFKYNEEYKRDNQALNNYLELENIRKEKLRLRQERMREERLKEEEELKLEQLRNEKIREERIKKEKERMRLEKLRQTRLTKGKDNLRRNEIIHKNKQIKKYNEIPMGNYPSQNNSINNKVYEYKYLKKIKNNSNNDNNRAYGRKINKAMSSNLFRRNNLTMNNDDKTISKKSIEYIRNCDDYNIRSKPKNKVISLLKVQQKTASLNYPNKNKKVDTYGENFDSEKYKREYINVENVNDGKIENHIETGISKDGQYLISVTSSRKIYDENNDRDARDGDMYIEEVEERNEEREDNNAYEVPEKEVQEIISTITTNRRNLGDNYKYHESKHLYKPNVTSFTSQRKRTERTIYGNEQHESREVKRYKIRPDVNEYIGKRQQITENTNYIPYAENEDYNEDEEYEQANYNYNREGDEQEQEGDYLNEEERYEQEEEENYD